MPELLEVRGVVAGYGRGPAILNGASLTVKPGQVQCIIGPNGAGKSTLLKAIVGLLPLRQGEVLLEGERIDGLRPDQVLRKGICFVPQERALFPKMSVRENLRMGGYVLSDQKLLDQRIEEVLEQFPILRERAHQHAGTMSGGQQQMLAMARTLLVKPKIVMLDEPSLGLAPQIVEQMFEIMHMLSRSGMTVILVEQNAIVGLKNSTWGTVLDLGTTLFEGPAADVLTDPRIQELYLGKTRTAA
ncbi:ABC transporter ATP-binding protein [Polymorphum gilvum]|uniref:ABC-type branched-chain amino acid transport systems ATPase component n=1 Tax=Polymorphum gilvum (strain LMG 25793 / CGMCC 1.9160 / SL003B-26A1) TaxID=991905 RepID=F2IYM4_POLGS|nr:ABC transporter ATP-binding protein [Polymorphum gilvum]ADZ69471.1 ABC-type branched-chain amino acid transport systems ATPase component [Polymorphum gilvum SL003B-26A1]